ncbi:LysR family transcriptional regulator [Tolumonas osonensis]|uniref:DNA-binding transcriptional LysR family regulator n=1 Tax=Tolumonas osonensis TaxID=675874 RepID=A0A841GHL9_9GAMM|nr:LysR family transcriptional regulator [Tolumonas osonensis]MBB6054741.1 DNA-binding transcriptional LysR family regulator [Tolumonas osonensis]
MRDIRTLDLNLLKTLDALLDERSVTRAAARLALTQPAVSSMLTRLRESFDDPLFVRTQRGIIPTPRAQALAAPVKRLLEEINQLLQSESFEPATATNTFTIAATDYALQAIIVPFMTRLRQHAPYVRLSVRTIEDERIQTQLETGQVDIALMTPETTPPDLHARRLFDERYVCTFRKDHPVMQLPLTLDQFCTANHAIVSYLGGAFRGATDVALEKMGRARNVTLSISSFLVLTEILRTSDLIAVVPEKLVQHQADLCVTEPPLAIPGFTKVAAWHERTHHDPAHQWLRALLFDLDSYV